MPQATFVLKEPNSTEVTLIYLLFRFNSTKLKYSTGQKVLPKLWNPDKQRVKEIRSNRTHESINMILDDLEASVGNAHRKLILENLTPTPELLRIRLNQYLKKEDSSSKDLAHFAEVLLTNSPKKDGTKRGIRQTIRNLKTFRDKTGKSLHFDSIDFDFYDKYLEFAQEVGYSHNTIGSHVKNVKAFMREAFERGLTKNMAFQSRRFKKLEEESQNIYLSLNELQKLDKLDLTGNSRLDKVRDLFMIGSYSGLRFSDLEQLKAVNFDLEKRIIKVRTQKTNDILLIPMNSTIIRIIQKYEGNPPSSISNVKMNEYLKELGEKAELKDQVEIISTKGGKRVKEIFKKYELITVHTARRSFATNAYLENVPAISIMKITGHKSEKNFLKYIKISQEENAYKLIAHPFFK